MSRILHQIWSFLRETGSTIDPASYMRSTYDLMQLHERAHLMAFPDPIEITIGTDPAFDLNRVSSGDGLGKFLSEDSNTKITVSHTSTKRGRVRRVARIDNQKVIPDVLLSGSSNVVDMSVSLVFDVPAQGYTPLESSNVSGALLNALVADSGALLLKFLTGQS